MHQLRFVEMDCGIVCTNASFRAILYLAQVLITSLYSPVIHLYAAFKPTFPNPLSPPAQTKLPTTPHPKHIQNDAWYPLQSTPASSSPAPSCAQLTLAATNAVSAKPTEFPICARVLNVPPANACVRSGNCAVMDKFEMVHRTTVSWTGGRGTVCGERDEGHCPDGGTKVGPMGRHCC
jgi:hypothetical protein